MAGKKTPGPLEPPAECPECGAKVDLDDARKCPECGLDVAEAWEQFRMRRAVRKLEKEEEKRKNPFAW